MATRTKEEDLLLDQKIAQIRKKNEEILKRAKEVEEDKKLAKEQNALVQLRPANVDDSRERTPALRPSTREFIKGNNETEDYPDVIARHPETPSFRGRGGRGGYNRERSERKDGPPPDPRSFLADSERDPPTPRDGQGKTYTRVEKGEESQKGNREFQRGGRKESRGRGGGRGDRMYQRETREEAWRAERLRIDEARIQRQKTADGKWRREWDSDKIHEEPSDDAKAGRGRGDARPVEQWKHSTHANSSPHGNIDHSHGRGRGGGGRGGRGGNNYYTDRGGTADSSFGHDMQRSHNNTPASSDFDNFRGRGVGRAAPHNKTCTPVLRRIMPNSPTMTRNDKSDQHASEADLVVDSSRGMQHRFVKNIGDSLEVFIANVQDERQNERFGKDRRHGGRFSRQAKNSRSSYSSQSEDETPKDKGFSKTKRDRGHFQNKPNHKASSHMTDEKLEHFPSEKIKETNHNENTNVETSVKDVEGSEQQTHIEDLCINIPQNQNPLPPFKAMSDVPKKTEEAENSNSPVITKSETSEETLIDNKIQAPESNLQQGPTETEIMTPAELKPPSVENNVVEVIKAPESSAVTVSSTVNDVVKESLVCDQKYADPCNEIVNTEQTEKSAGNTDMHSEEANPQAVQNEINIENQKADLTKLKENEIKIENPVATEKQEIVGEGDVLSGGKSEEKVLPETKSEEKMSLDINSDLTVASSDSNNEKTSDHNKENSENKETLPENIQNTVSVTETATASKDIKSAE